MSLVTKNNEIIESFVAESNFDFHNCTDKSKQGVISYLEGYRQALSLRLSDLEIERAKIDIVLIKLKGE